MARRLDLQAVLSGSETRPDSPGRKPQLGWLPQEARTNGAAYLTAALFVFFILPTCLLLALLVPPGEVPDEPAHLLRADSLLYGKILGERHPVMQDGKTTLQAGIWGNWGLFTTDLPGPLGHLEQKKMSAAKMAAIQSSSWSKQAQWVWYPTTATYMPLFYVPAAAAVGVAQLIHATPYHAILSARITNVFCFIAIGVCALLLAKRGRFLLFCVLALPMTILLAASCNPDGLIIATSALAFALLTRAREPRGFAYWTAALLLAAVIAAKFPYFPLAFLLLIPCDWRSRRKSALLPGLRTAVLAILPGAIWATITIQFVATPYPLFGAYHPGYLWPGNHDVAFETPNSAAQIKVFLHRPLYTVVLPVKTLETNAEWVRNSMIGMFGWVEFGMRGWMYTVWIWALALAVLGDVLGGSSDDTGPPWAAFVLGLLAVAATFFAIYDAEYLNWTRVGAPVIDGVQGRYLLPLLAAFAAFLRAVHIRGAVKWRIIAAIPAFAMAAIGMVVLPSLMVSTYYLR